MLQQVDVGTLSLAHYRGETPDEVLDEVRDLAEDLRGARVLHVNATPYGGGVSELLRSLVPLLCDVGVDAEWRIIAGNPEFFRLTKEIHNGLQGQAGDLPEEDREHFLATTRANARALALAGGYDLVVVHDPQPVPLAGLAHESSACWVWRCHIDTSSPNLIYLDFLRAFLDEYDGLVFTMAEFVPPGVDPACVHVVPPAIDPLSPKNMHLPEQLARDVLNWLGIDLGFPLITQVSRFDPWKDPLGVLDIYRRVRRHNPRLQLVLAGSMALDDPEGWHIYHAVREQTADDPLAHVFTNLTGVGNIEINALQRLSTVALQLSIREGFGLVVSETLWKGTPMVARRAGGIPMQMANGRGGVLADSREQVAEALCTLLDEPDEAERIGAAGREHVREHYTMPRLLRDELRVMKAVGVEARRGRRPVG